MPQTGLSIILLSARTNLSAKTAKIAPISQNFSILDIYITSIRALCLLS